MIKTNIVHNDNTVKTIYAETLYNSKILCNVSSICTMYQFSLNSSSLQQKFSLTSDYLGTNIVVLKKVDCNNKVVSNFCMLLTFFLSADFFQNHFFSKEFFQEHHQHIKQFGSKQFANVISRRH